MTQQGDVLLFQTNDDGNITVENGIVKMSGGLDTSAYLSLFGGNEDCSGGVNCPFTWWGNFSEIDDANKYISETQFLLKSIPAISINLRRIEDAVKRDLKWFLNKKIASDILVLATIPGLNKIKIEITIKAQGLESSFEFIENWKAGISEPSEIDNTGIVSQPLIRDGIEWIDGDPMEWTGSDDASWTET